MPMATTKNKVVTHPYKKRLRIPTIEVFNALATTILCYYQLLLCIYKTLADMAAITFTPLSEEQVDRLKFVYHEVFEKGQSFIRTIPGYVTMPMAFEKYKHRLKNWQLRHDDVYVLTFPKNGTTWTQELVWLLQNECNFEVAKTTTLTNRFPFLDIPILTEYRRDELTVFKQRDFLAKVEKMSSPRLMKSHFRLCLLPDDLLEKSKIVICLRNPKDTVVSYYHHEKRVKNYGYKGDFQTFFGLFMDNLIRYCSYFDYVKEVWQQRNHPNVCLLFFEDMKKDLASSVRQAATFLKKNISNNTVDALVDHLSFMKMKNNPAVNKEDLVLNGMYTNHESHFMRNGEVGDWKNYFTDEMNKRMDEAIEKHFKPIGLEFQYE